MGNRKKQSDHLLWSAETLVNARFFPHKVVQQQEQEEQQEQGSGHQVLIDKSNGNVTLAEVSATGRDSTQNKNVPTFLLYVRLK
jgi:hypothetical protein